jgi:hypothetical protein
MAISDTQKVDYLWKKVGYGVAKTATGDDKKAYEEAIASPLLIRGDRIWQLSASIPAIIPTSTASPVTVYKDGSGSWTATVQTTEDTTVADNRTWKTGLTDWIPVEFGSTYQVQVYIDTAGSTTAQSTGTKIFAAGSGNSDEWYFDYQAGVLNFIGDNLPSALGGGNTSNRIFISGARYTGPLGVTSSPSATITVADIGNLHIEDVTITSNNTDANIVLDPNGTGNVVLNAVNSVVTGNLTIQGNLVLTQNSTSDRITANAVITPKIESSATNVAVGSMTLVDSFLPTTYRTAKYVIKASDNTGYESVEVLLIHNGTDSYVTVYGAISTTNQDIISLSSNVYSGNVCLWAANYAGRTSTYVNFVGTYVKD